jgi:hypothetical protein
MAERMSTASRYDRLRDKQKVSRALNGMTKRKERARRHHAMVEAIKKCKFPNYTPTLKSWIAHELSASWDLISEDDVKKLVG